MFLAGNLLKVQKIDIVIENLLNPDFTNMRASFFLYHREGMDNFTEKPDLVRENIADALIKLLDVYNQRPKSYLIQLFLILKLMKLLVFFSRYFNASKSISKCSY